MIGFVTFTHVYFELTPEEGHGVGMPQSTPSSFPSVFDYSFSTGARVPPPTN
jgi:hypothetical protein